MDLGVRLVRIGYSSSKTFSFKPKLMCVRARKGKVACMQKRSVAPR